MLARNSVLYILINKGKTLKKWVKHLQRARSSMLDKALAPRSSTLARKIPWTEESSRLQSTGSLRVVSLYLFPFMHWRRKWQPTPVLLPGKSHGQRSLEGYSSWGPKRVWHNLATKQTSNALSFLHRSPTAPRQTIYTPVSSSEAF